MTDPYKTLGVSPNADKDEIKKAYRALAKKYHPDSNPGDKVAEQKMKEINAAYDAIINGSADSYSQNSYGGYSQNRTYGQGYGSYGGFSGFDQSAYQESDPYLKAAQNYIYSGYYDSAINALNQVPSANRGARWYYYSAMAHFGAGNNDTARRFAQTAVNMEPNNMQYRNLYENLNNPGSYSQHGGPFVYTTGTNNMSLGRYCLSCLAINLLCRFCFCC